MTDPQELMQRLMGAEQSSREDYLSALQMLDVAVCEAMAVGQAQAGRAVSPTLGYATYVFARLCAYGVAAIRAAPLSRWVRSDSEDWGFNVLASHARAILEGYLYFTYLVQPENEQQEEGRARITLLQLNDCCSRIKLFVTNPEQARLFEQQADDLRARLRSIEFFRRLPPAVRAQCLAGGKAWFMDRAQLVDLVGFEKPAFDIAWNLFSQHSHIHPVSFYRIEPNGRGTGLECDPDRAYLGFAMILSASILTEATDKLVGEFPDVASVRRGLDSKFSPGPKRNRPRGSLWERILSIVPNAHSISYE